jgi:hypothetical protein
LYQIFQNEFFRSSGKRERLDSKRSIMTESGLGSLTCGSVLTSPFITTSNNESNGWKFSKTPGKREPNAYEQDKSPSDVLKKIRSYIGSFFFLYYFYISFRKFRNYF